MRKIVQAIFVSAALLTAGAPGAQTQPSPPTPPAPSSPPTAPKPTLVAPASPTPPRMPAVLVGKRRQMSSEERRKEVDRALADMRALLTKAIDLLAAARRDKDIVRLNCVQEKVTALKALLRVGEQASVSIQESVARGDADTADYEFQRVAVARSRSQQMSAEANSCVGVDAVYTGPVSREVEIDPEIPTRDPTLKVEPVNRVDQFPSILDRPQALSPPY
jgi:hypothetical protein